MTVKVVCISDTHGKHWSLKVPRGDILIHAGDQSRGKGDLHQLIDFDKWISKLPHKHKIVIAGNHDLMFENQANLVSQFRTSYTYLQDSSVTCEGLKIYGSPWQPWFHDWGFNLRRGPEIAAKWAQIPPDTDILVTHGPPYGILDQCLPGHAKNNLDGGRAGCKDLLPSVVKLKPRLHVFGHIHEGYGTETHGPTQFVNASVLDRNYQLVNNAIEIEIELEVE